MIKPSLTLLSDARTNIEMCLYTQIQYICGHTSMILEVGHRCAVRDDADNITGCCLDPQLQFGSSSLQTLYKESFPCSDRTCRVIFLSRRAAEYYVQGEGLNIDVDQDHFNAAYHELLAQAGINAPTMQDLQHRSRPGRVQATRDLSTAWTPLFFGRCAVPMPAPYDFRRRIQHHLVKRSNVFPDGQSQPSPSMAHVASPPRFPGILHACGNAPPAMAMSRTPVNTSPPHTNTIPTGILNANDMYVTQSGRPNGSWRNMRLIPSTNNTPIPLTCQNHAMTTQQFPRAPIHGGTATSVSHDDPSTGAVNANDTVRPT